MPGGRAIVRACLAHPFAARSLACSPRSRSRARPRYRAHALADGTFSLTDAVATAELRKSCPKLPTKFVGDAPPFPHLDGARVECARTRGESAASVIRRLRAECAPLQAQATKCEGPCVSLGYHEMVAGFEPRVRL